MRKRLLVLLMTAVMVMMSAAPAMAAPSGGCKAWGHFVRNLAHRQAMDDRAHLYIHGSPFFGDWNDYIRAEKEFQCSSF
jgi:hypothetical protein